MANQNKNVQNVSASTQTYTPMPAPVASPVEQMLATTLAALAESNKKISDLMEQQAAYNKEALRIAPRRKKTMVEYLDERRKRGAGKRLLHNVWQNGRPVNPSGLSDETINRLDTLNTGKYCDGMVDVVRIRDGVGGINSRIHIMYNNGNEMERMAFYMRFPTFTKLVNDIADEMARLYKAGDKNYAPVQEQVADPVEPEFPENL